MNEQYYEIYKELEIRYVKIAWTHKIQEIQADLYFKRSSMNKWVMAIASAVTTTSAFATVIMSLCGKNEWIGPLITSLLSVVSATITFRYKDGTLDNKADECKKYAAKCHDIRNQYESLLTDVMSGRYSDLESICEKRDDLTKLENDLFSGEVAPHTTKEAVTLAEKALKDKEESLTTDEEIMKIVPKHLQKI